MRKPLGSPTPAETAKFVARVNIQIFPYQGSKITKRAITCFKQSVLRTSLGLQQCGEITTICPFLSLSLPELIIEIIVEDKPTVIAFNRLYLFFEEKLSHAALDLMKLKVKMVCQPPFRWWSHGETDVLVCRDTWYVESMRRMWLQALDRQEELHRR